MVRDLGQKWDSLLYLAWVTVIVAVLFSNQGAPLASTIPNALWVKGRDDRGGPYFRGAGRGGARTKFCGAGQR